MQKIRILHVVTLLNRGGLETMLMNIYRNIDKDKFEFSFLVHRNGGDYEEEIESIGGKIYRLPHLSFTSYFNYVSEIDRFFKQHNQFDIVHVHNNTFGFFPLKYAAKYGIKNRIIHSHIGLMPQRSLKEWIGAYLKTKIPKYATDFFACGQAAGEWLYPASVDFKIINNAIDAAEFKYDAEKSLSVSKKFSAEHTFNIINVARFSPQKNHQFIIELFEELVQREPNARLFLVGEGTLQHSIEEMVAAKSLQEKVFFLGVRKDINEVLQMADVFLMPSFFEGLPVALIEAQAAGLPCVVSTGVPTEAEIVPGYVQFIDLKQPKSEWIDKLLAAKEREKQDTSAVLKEAGYDIKTNISWLEQYYATLVPIK